jgi:hypothetical protein
MWYCWSVRAPGQVACVVMVLSLAGCGGAGDSTSSAPAGSGAATSSPATTARATRPAKRPARRPTRSPHPAPAAGLARRTKTSGCQVHSQLPDPACTPGAVFAAATVGQICTPGYARNARNVPESLKETVYADYATEPSAPGSYEVDHLVPLELGGSNAIANLWPEITPGYHEKDKVENALHDAVCSGRIPVRVAQLAIARDWRRAGVVVPGAGPAPPPMPAPAPAGAGSPTGGEGPGSTTHSGDAAFCSTHACIANFPNGKGAVVRCADGEWSHSGGLTGVCNRHGGSR